MKIIITACLLLLINNVQAEINIIIGEDESVELRTLDHNSELHINSKATGRIKLPGKFGINDFCTVSLINESQVITASHCIVDVKQITKVKAYFEYYDSGSKSLNPISVLSVHTSSNDTDVATLNLEGKPGLQYGHYELATNLPATGAQLLIYEHQGLSPKSVSYVNCNLRSIEGARLTHTCDTNNYSSGAPILNDNFELIGVHQGGLVNMNEMYNYGRVLVPGFTK